MSNPGCKNRNGWTLDRIWGSRKNKFAFLSVEAPAWQGAKAPEYRDISSFRNAARQDAPALEIVKLFLSEPFLKNHIQRFV
jgi:hypothetical protein